jgi:hypothetical protein
MGGFMSAPEGEQRCQGVCNTGKPANDKRLQASYYETDDFAGVPSLIPPGSGFRGGRPLVNTQVRMLEKDGRIIFSFSEEIQSNIPAYRTQTDGLTATTLVMDAFARADYRNLATPWEILNSPICVFANRYQPVLDDGDQVVSYLRIEWITGVAHAQSFSVDGILFKDDTIGELALKEDVLGNELVAAVATLGGSLLIRSLARAAITSSSRFLGTAIAETAIDAARGVTTSAFRIALLGLRGIRGRLLVELFKSRGVPIVVNIGGTAAKHELAEGAQIAVNPLVQGIKRTIPNLIKADGESIGSLFGKKTVDKIISNRLPTSVNTEQIAKGAADVMKDGGQLEMHFFTTDAEFMDKFAEQLLKNGFRSAKPQLLPPFAGAKPVPTGLMQAIR